jgi:HEPN domain-containing protein
MSSNWLVLAVRDCNSVLHYYENLWLPLFKLQNGEIFKEEFCENYCPHFPCKKCPNKGAEECYDCHPSCEVGSGKIVCFLKSLPSYSSNVCYLAQQCYEKFLKYLIKVAGSEPPRTHDLIKLLNMLPSHLRSEIEDLVECIYFLKNYNIARYIPSLSEEDTFFCKKCVEKLLILCQKMGLW